MNTVWIIGGGDIDLSWARGLLKERTGEDFIIAADKGGEYLAELGIIPDLLIGDMDSVNPDNCSVFKDSKVETDIHPVRKDETDTRLAILEAIKYSPENVCILGAMGGRQDHFLGNVYLLGELLENNVKGCICDELNRISLIKPGEYCYEKENRYGKYFSILPFAGDAVIEYMRGFSYELDKPLKLRKWDTIGISNEITEAKAELFVKEGWVLVIEASDKKYDR